MDKLEYIPGDLAFHYIPKTIIKKVCKSICLLYTKCLIIRRYGWKAI